MQYIITLAFIITSCTAMPQLYQALEDVADDTAIKCEISKEAFKEDTKLRVIVEIQNGKDEK